MGKRLVVLLALSMVVGCGTRISRSEVIRALGAQTGNAGVSSGQTGGDANTAGADAQGQQPVTGAGGAGATNGAGSQAGGRGGATATGGQTLGGGAYGPGGAAGGSATSGSSGGRAAGGGVTALGPATGTPVVIGNIGEYSGAVGASLASGQPMVQVVAKWLNAHGGLNNHPIKIITADDQSDPSRYLALAKDMVENQHAIAFLGNMVPLSAPGADPYLTQKGVAVIGGDGAAPLWFQSPDMFFAGTTYAGLASGSLSYMVQQKKPKVAALYCGEAAPCRAYNQAFAAAAPGKGAQVVYTAQISLAQPDFTAECLQAQSHGAQVLSLGMDADSVVRVTRSCVQQGYRPLFATASLVLVNSLAQDPDTNGIIATVPTFPWFQNDLPGEHDYHQAIQQYAPNLPTSTSTSAEWIAGLMLQAAGAHLPANPVPADIQNGLWSIKDSTFGGLTPPTTFTKGQPSPAQNCYYLVQNRDGQWVGPNGSQPLC